MIEGVFTDNGISAPFYVPRGRILGLEIGGIWNAKLMFRRKMGITTANYPQKGDAGWRDVQGFVGNTVETYRSPGAWFDLKCSLHTGGTVIYKMGKGD